MSKKDPLTLDEVVSKTGGAGQRLRWRLFAAADGTPQASTTFAWRVEQQSNVLLAIETAGVVEQPVVRPVSR